MLGLADLALAHVTIIARAELHRVRQGVVADTVPGISGAGDEIAHHRTATRVTLRRRFTA